MGEILSEVCEKNRISYATATLAESLEFVVVWKVKGEGFEK